MNKANKAVGVAAVKPVVVATAPPAPVVKPASEPKAKKVKLSPRDKAVQHVGRQCKRIERLAKALAAWGPETKEAADALVEAHVYVAQASRVLAKLPEDFKPAKGAGSQASAASERLAVGAIVEVAFKARKGFEGALDPADMDHLEVVRVNNKQVVVKTRDGLRTMIHSTKLRAHGHSAREAARIKASE